MSKNRCDTREVIGECIYGLCDIGERADMRIFSRRIRESFLKIDSVYRKIQKMQSTDDLSPPLMWLWENYYVIEKSYENIKETCKRLPRLPAFSENPRLYVAARRFCKLCDCDMDGDICSELLLALSDSCTLGLREYFCAKELLSAAFLSESSEVLSEYLKAPIHSETSDDTLYCEKLERVIISLRNIREHDFTGDVLKSRCAKILSKDPSGAFPFMARETKLMYLQKIMENAEKEGMSERKYARWLLEKAERSEDSRERHVGYPLFHYPGYRKVLYFGCLFFTSSFFTLLLSVFVSPFCLLLAFPIFEIVRFCLDKVSSKLVKVQPFPKMETEKIDFDKAVLVVVTSILTGQQSDLRLFEKLENLYISNSEENVFFALVCDLPGSQSATAPGDSEIIKHAYGRINALNLKYGKRFILFERRRSYSKGEEAFMGWERKWGAVTELVRLLKGKHTTFSEKSIGLSEEVLRSCRIKYVITLDADTNLPLGAVRSMYGTMVHPLAKPHIDKKSGIVTKGYGIMQPMCFAEISSAGTTPFARLLCGKGVDARFDIYQNLFGESFFCGKGIFDVDVFYEVIDRHNTFPEDRILCCDSLVGAKLRCALIDNLTLTEGFPKNTLLYQKRRHRQIRGSVQNLPFLFLHVKTGSGKVRNSINFLSRYNLFLNTKDAFLRISSYFCIIVSAFARDAARPVLLTFALLHLFLPFVFELLKLHKIALSSILRRRFFSKGIFISAISEFLKMLYNTSALATDCYFCLDAVSRSLYRMFISGKRLLEWQTNAQSDSSGGILMFVYKNMFSVISAFLLFVLSGSGILRFISILWFAFPVISYHMSFNSRKAGKQPCKDITDSLTRYSRDSWKYFEDYVTEESCFLPPENITVSPFRTAAETTSPTSIGLYLLSALSARDFGFIDSCELYHRVDKTLKSIEKMKKYKGHLFKYYNTKNLDATLPLYLSTSDSGNLTACLIVLHEGLSDYVSEKTGLLELMAKTEALIKETDYSFLYSKERNLYRRGAELSENGSSVVQDECFDIYMNHGRMVSYIECSRRNAPLKHWYALSRELITIDRYIGMASQSGTASEYFLPALFLPIYRRSLCYEAFNLAYKEQRNRFAFSKGIRLWGSSESYYNESCVDGNYKSGSFGIPSLGLENGLENHLVLSPYSSFLMLCIDSSGAAANLRNFQDAAFYGEYGFYEAIDFTPGRSKKDGSAVKCFVSRHLGMSICAAANEVFDNIHVRRFMRYGSMRCGEELLRESIPANVIIRKAKYKKVFRNSTKKDTGKVFLN